MKVLFLSRVLPHLKGNSGSVIIFNRIRHLAEHGHEIGLIAFLGKGDERYVDDVRPYVRDVEFIPVNGGRSHSIHDRHCCSIPTVFRDAYDEGVFKLVGSTIESGGYAAVVAEYSAMGQYLYRNRYLPAVRKMISCHQCCTLVSSQTIRIHSWSRQGMLGRMRLKKLMNYEFDMYRSVDRVLVLSRQERNELLRYAPDLKISVIPHGVDVSYFQPVDLSRARERILYLGDYSLEANCDAVLWFHSKVWPSLKREFPELEFCVLGRRPPESILALARKDKSIIVTGEVDDVREHLAQARVFICPVRIGSGMRPKILEAMASGMPIVSTTTGLEGIHFWDSNTLLAADTPGQLRKCVGMLLRDKELRITLAANARNLAVERFSQQDGLDELERVVLDVTGKQ